MSGRQTNLALLALLIAAFATGWVAFSFLGAPARWALTAHATAGVAILLLVPWKSVMARPGLARRRPIWWASIVLSGLALISLAFGFLHSAGRPYLGFGLSAMEVHVGAAVALIPFAVWHVLARPVRPRAVDLARRSLLRAGALVGLAGLTYAGTELAVRAIPLPGARRRLTGSYEVPAVAVADLPGTQWMFDGVPAIDSERWRLRVSWPGGARVWSHAELATFTDGLRATLDCTGGWYSELDWEGAWLSRLLPARTEGSLLVRSATGYWRRFDVADAPRLLLALRAGGGPLDPDHGFPVRLVAAGERGFWWVKWVSEIRVEPLPSWWQPPFPLQ